MILNPWLEWANYPLWLAQFSLLGGGTCFSKRQGKACILWFLIGCTIARAHVPDFTFCFLNGQIIRSGWPNVPCWAGGTCLSKSRKQGKACPSQPNLENVLPDACCPAPSFTSWLAQFTLLGGGHMPLSNNANVSTQFSKFAACYLLADQHRVSQTFAFCRNPKQLIVLPCLEWGVKTFCDAIHQSCQSVCSGD